MWKKMRIVVWSVLGIATCTLLIAAMKKKEKSACTGVTIQIDGAYDHVFVDRNDVQKMLQQHNVTKGKPVDEIPLQSIEAVLRKNAWVKDADLFFDNKQLLHVDIQEREPVARIFTKQGSSFYIDTACVQLPLSDALSARVLMFTSYPSTGKKLSKPDSALMNDIKNLSVYIRKDSFLNAQVASVNITDDFTFEMTPVVGNQVIRLGNAEDLDEKFNKLKAFYKQVWAKAGFEKYGVIDLRFRNQVVAVKRDSKNSVAITPVAIQPQVATVQGNSNTNQQVVTAKTTPATNKVQVKAKPQTVKAKQQPKALMKKN